ncbi:hypothetical protein CERSUDRAFT_49786, partial [Gelatoporia subvermispora B]
KSNRKYNKFGRTYLFDIDFWHLRAGLEDPESWDVKYLVDAYHVGNFTRYLNHSCDPNCILNPCYINDANIDKPLLAIFTLRDVEPREELCFSYYGFDDDNDPEGQVTSLGADFDDTANIFQCRTSYSIMMTRCTLNANAEQRSVGVACGKRDHRTIVVQ